VGDRREKRIDMVKKRRIYPNIPTAWKGVGAAFRNSKSSEAIPDAAAIFFSTIYCHK
jgi:hypothetical protein